ncbi:class I SAM-dependent methyltransferase [Humibacillus xanthopallidus]|uniref:Methyltransferase family protein n=1 Tax=Humibacillus xanthopallidus TaxID=412689 RepID=A0A543HVY6_9MICO|nr:class I SAM-dependent methyltransferase [Humibacillus xanthopallidus]TQM62503.1 methyltransferase family protein [Humibacillus xanthopallidus]
MKGPEAQQPRAQPVDYDLDIDRFLTNQTATRLFSTSGDVHEPVADQLQLQHAGGRVLDLGGGNGLLARHLQDRGLSTVVLDQARYVTTAPPPVVMADAERLPFAGETFNAVAALWMLYHVAEPLTVLRQAAMVLRPGGTFVACAPSRYNDPEFEAVLPEWGYPSTFDAEDAAELIGRVFDVVDVERWDAPLMSLRDAVAVEQFLRGRGLSPQAAAEAATGFERPVTVTKRGAVVWGRVR